MPSLSLAIMELPGSVGWQSVRRHGHWCLHFCDTLEEGGSPFRVNPVLPMLMLTSHPEGKGSLRREAVPRSTNHRRKMIVTEPLDALGSSRTSTISAAAFVLMAP